VKICAWFLKQFLNEYLVLEIIDWVNYRQCQSVFYIYLWSYPPTFVLHHLSQLLFCSISFYCSKYNVKYPFSENINLFFWLQWQFHLFILDSYLYLFSSFSYSQLYFYAHITFLPLSKAISSPNIWHINYEFYQANTFHNQLYKCSYNCQLLNSNSYHTLHIEYTWVLYSLLLSKLLLGYHS
jgi:hypothetical protein